MDAIDKLIILFRELGISEATIAMKDDIHRKAINKVMSDRACAAFSNWSSGKKNPNEIDYFTINPDEPIKNEGNNGYFCNVMVTAYIEPPVEVDILKDGQYRPITEGGVSMHIEQFPKDRWVLVEPPKKYWRDRYIIKVKKVEKKK